MNPYLGQELLYQSETSSREEDVSQIKITILNTQKKEDWERVNSQLFGKKVKASRQIYNKISNVKSIWSMQNQALITIQE